MLASAVAHGLKPGPQILAELEKVTEKNDYVRVRYMVVEVAGDIPSVKVLRLVDAVRECVRRGLGYDELGRPVAATTATKKPRRRLQSGRGNRTTQTAT